MSNESVYYYVNFKKLILNLGHPCKCQKSAVCICDNMKTKKNCICQFILREEEYLDNKSILKENFYIKINEEELDKILKYYNDI